MPKAVRTMSEEGKKTAVIYEILDFCQEENKYRWIAYVVGKPVGTTGEGWTYDIGEAEKAVKEFWKSVDEEVYDVE